MNFPLAITLARLIAPVLICPLLFVTGPWMGAATWAAAIVFTVAALSDWVDGYLARRWGETSAWGRILDPIADKTLALLTLLGLAATDRLGPWALILGFLMLFREVAVAALREGLAPEGRVPSVTGVSKTKTLLFFIALGLLILGGNAALWGLSALALATLLAYISGYFYFREALEG